MKSLLLALGLAIILSSCSFGKSTSSSKDERNTIVDGTVATSTHSGGQKTSTPLPVNTQSEAGVNDGFDIK